MYCISIAEQSGERCRSLMADTRAEMVELRGDLCKLCPEELHRVVVSHPNVLYTCHLAEVELAWAEEQYRAAIGAGAKYVDIEISAPEQFREQVIALAHRAGAIVVVSYHNWSYTPSAAELVDIAKECWSAGGTIAKVVTTATDSKDIIEIGKLYRTLPTEKRARLVAFAMGSEGVQSRRLSLIEGAPFTFAAPDGGTPTAAGQPQLGKLTELMMYGQEIPTLTIPAVATLPSSKSHFQRAIVAATLAEGRSRLEYNGKLADDSLSAIEWARSLGTEVEIADNSLLIKGIGLKRVARQLPHTFDVGESGLLARLTMGIVAMIGGGATIVGHGTLTSRYFGKEIETLHSLGLEVKSHAGRLPITIDGQIIGEHIEVDASHSSQLASGLLMGAPLRQRATTLTINSPTSRPYLDITLDVMGRFGIACSADERIIGGSSEPIRVHIDGKQHYEPQTIAIESDWSSAGYLMAAAAIAQSGHSPRTEGYEIGRMNISSLQADRLIMNQLLMGNCNIELTNSDKENQDICDIVVYPTERLSPIVCNASDAPDAIPTLAIIALFADGQSRIGGLGRLTNKESNRRSALVAELLALGGDIEIEGDELVVNGGKPLRQSRHYHQHIPTLPLCTYGDHRMAMALAVASIFIGNGRCTLDHPECVAKSWPAFWEVFKFEQ